MDFTKLTSSEKTYKAFYLYHTPIGWLSGKDGNFKFFGC